MVYKHNDTVVVLVIVSKVVSANGLKEYSILQVRVNYTLDD